MKNLILTALILLVLTIIGCGGSNKTPNYTPEVGDVGTITKGHYAYYLKDIDITAEDMQLKDEDGNIIVFASGDMTVFRAGDTVIITGVDGNYIEIRRVDEERTYWIYKTLFKLE